MTFDEFTALAKERTSQITDSIPSAYVESTIRTCYSNISPFDVERRIAYDDAIETVVRMLESRVARKRSVEESDARFGPGYRPSMTPQFE